MKILKLNEEQAQLVVAGLRAIGGTLHQNPDARQAAHWSILIGQVIQELVPSSATQAKASTQKGESKAASKSKS